MPSIVRSAALAIVCTFATAATAQVQPIQPVRCSAFLHNRDGSWTSFVNAMFLGSHGPVPVHPGQRFTGRGSMADVDLDRILNGLCQSD